MKLEKKSTTGQQEIVASYRDDFHKTPITEFSDVWVGDHFVDEGKFYSHHMLCTATYGKEVKVIHYTGPNLGVLGTFSGLSCKDLGVLGIIREETISVHELVKQKVSKCFIQVDGGICALRRLLARSCYRVKYATIRF